MFDRILSERNNQLLSNEEKNTPIDTNTAEFKELSFHFNTIFNDISQKSVSSDSKILTPNSESNALSEPASTAIAIIKNTVFKSKS